MRYVLLAIAYNTENSIHVNVKIWRIVAEFDLPVKVDCLVDTSKVAYDVYLAVHHHQRTGYDHTFRW